MLGLVFKRFWREGDFIKVGIILIGIPLNLLGISGLIGIVFFVLQDDFLKPVMRYERDLLLYRITVAPLCRILLYRNLVFVFWINVWIVIGKIIILFPIIIYDLMTQTSSLKEFKFLYNPYDLLVVNTLAIVLLIIGNILAYSDLETIKLKWFKGFVKTSLFIIFGIIAMAFIILISRRTLGLLIIFPAVMGIWYWTTTRIQHFDYFKFYVS